MTPTPETDAHLIKTIPSISDVLQVRDTVSADFARKLERERDEWKAKAERTCLIVTTIHPMGFAFNAHECGGRSSVGEHKNFCANCGGRIVKEGK